MLILKVRKAYHVEPLAHRQTFVTTLLLEDVFGTRAWPRPRKASVLFDVIHQVQCSLTFKSIRNVNPPTTNKSITLYCKYFAEIIKSCINIAFIKKRTFYFILRQLLCPFT